MQTAAEKEDESRRAALETRTDPKKAKEHHKREQHAQKAAAELEKVPRYAGVSQEQVQRRESGVRKHHSQGVRHRRGCAPERAA